MHTTDVPLAADERRYEIAAILATGVVRLKTCAESLSACLPVASATQTASSPAQAGSAESPACGPGNTAPTSLPQAEKLSESSRNCLDASATPRTHVPAV